MLLRRERDLNNRRIQTREVCSTSTSNEIKLSNGPTSDQNIPMMKKENPKKKVSNTIDPRIGFFNLNEELPRLKMKVKKIPCSSSNNRKFYQKYDIPATRSFPSTLIKCLQSIDGNGTCVDCILKSDKNISEYRPVTWANLSFGTLICNECAFEYFSKDVKCSLLSTDFSFWTLPDIIAMFEGGNGRLFQELDANRKLNFLKRKSNRKVAKDYELSLARRVAILCSLYSQCDVTAEAILEQRTNRENNFGMLATKLPKLPKVVDVSPDDIEDKPKSCQRHERTRSLSFKSLADLMKNDDHQDDPKNRFRNSDSQLMEVMNQLSSSSLKKNSSENSLERENLKKRNSRRNSSLKNHEDDGHEEIRRNRRSASDEARRDEQRHHKSERQRSSKHQNRRMSEECDSNEIKRNRSLTGDKGRGNEHREDRPRSSRHVDKSNSRRNDFESRNSSGKEPPSGREHPIGKDPEETVKHDTRISKRKNKETSDASSIKYMGNDDDTAIAVLFQSGTEDKLNA